MTIAEANRFYEEDNHKYILEKNKDYISWLGNAIDDGYSADLDMIELQELIDYIVCWYEIKYPDKDFEYNEGIIYSDFNNIQNMSSIMDFDQLLYRLTTRQAYFLLGGYRSKGWGQYLEEDPENGTVHKSKIFVKITDQADGLTCFHINADALTGKVLKYFGVEEYLNKDGDTYVDDILRLFDEEYEDRFDYADLEDCVFNHDLDLELRHRVLQLAALKMLYSRNTTPERGYERAKRFINDFNNSLGLLLSTDEIDEIMSKDYSVKSKKSKIRRLFG